MLRVNLLSDLSKISISPGGNQVVVLHLNNAAGNDLVLSLTTSEDKIGELVGRIASRMTKVCLEMDYHCKPYYRIIYKSPDESNHHRIIDLLFFFSLTLGCQV